MLLLGLKRQTPTQQTTHDKAANYCIECYLQRSIPQLNRALFSLFFYPTQAYVYLRDNSSDNQHPAPKRWDFTNHVFIRWLAPNDTFPKTNSYAT